LPLGPRINCVYTVLRAEECGGVPLSVSPFSVKNNTIKVVIMFSGTEELLEGG
jgi:hypothetical protein